MRLGTLVALMSGLAFMFASPTVAVSAEKPVVIIVDESYFVTPEGKPASVPVEKRPAKKEYRWEQELKEDVAARQLLPSTASDTPGFTYDDFFNSYFQ